MADLGWLLAAWALWAALNVLALVYAQRRVVRLGSSELNAYAVGLLRPRIVMPPELAWTLTAAEYAAVYWHERGHLAHNHVRWNLARAVLLPFWPRSARQAMRQELEADAYAVQQGAARHLASAIRKMSTHPFDLRRAEELERAASRRDADAPRAGCALSTM